MLDPAVFREVMRTYPTGVTVVTAADDSGAPLGLTVNSFTSVSLDPPLVLVCIDRAAGSHDRLVSAGRFIVNVLAADQGDVAARFAADPPEERFSGLPWRAAAGGGPILEGGAAWLACTIEAVHAAGDHSILVARVTDGHATGAPSLVFFHGAYAELEP